MDRSLSVRIVGLALGVVLPLTTATTSRAAAIPSYTVTDLGAGAATFTTDPGGNQYVVAPDGATEYAFPRAPGYQGDVQEAMKALPALGNAPVWSQMTYGNPENAFSEWLPGSFINANGLFVGTDNVGVYGHSAGAQSMVVAAQRQDDGTFGPLTTLWSSPNNTVTGGAIARAIALNNQGQVLGQTAPYGSSMWYATSYLLYDTNSRTQIDLSSLVPGWTIGQAIALDDQGRILLSANSAATNWEAHALLLSPADLSGEPTPVPEPSTVAVLGLGLAGLAVARRRARARRAESGDDTPRGIC